MSLGAVVLCGGESRRMGRPKAWLPFGPELMLQRVVRLIGTVAQPIVVVAAPPLPAPVADTDEVEGRLRVALQSASVREAAAIVAAASVRLRPILMTTAAMVVGMAPLIFATGAGAVSRFNIGVTIFAGMAIGTLFTLFVTPAVYTFLARDHAALMAKEKALGHLKEEVEVG